GGEGGGRGGGRAGEGRGGVSPAVDAFLRRCGAPARARRYQSARQLQEDLQCQFDSLPLKHTREPLGERIRKRLRRSPRLKYWVAIGAALLLLTLAVGFAVRAREQQKDEEARRKEEEARALHLGRVKAARSTLHATTSEIL